MLESIVTLIVINILRKHSQRYGLEERLQLRLQPALAISIVVLVVAAAKMLGHWGSLVLSLTWYGIVAWHCLTIPTLRPVRQIYFATIPVVFVPLVATILKSTVPGFFDSWKWLLDTITVFAVIWAITVLIVRNKQQKALRRAQAEAAAKQQELEISEAMKAELEKQVAARTADILKQKEALEHALNNLKATQQQLVHAEKMASLGELTAGIAHEIQNPLNFVNNFSEISQELVQELITEAERGHISETRVLANDISSNLAKILHHGKRADGIVKGMLQHSRGSSGQKEPTNLNTMGEEYLRLAYHGLRAKDKSFQATLETNLDEHLGLVPTIPQDIGRVLLNLMNNACYAVMQKAVAAREQNLDYDPKVILTTKRRGAWVDISISDNGNGIPAHLVEKVFQPFFTTKPTGEGTGLGLSLSFDIVTKGHGGQLNVQNHPGEGCTFTLHLPAPINGSVHETA